MPVISVEQGQEVSENGELVETFTAQFRFADRPGIWTVEVRGVDNWSGRLIDEIHKMAADIGAVYSAL